MCSSFPCVINVTKCHLILQTIQFFWNWGKLSSNTICRWAAFTLLFLQGNSPGVDSLWSDCCILLRNQALKITLRFALFPPFIFSDTPYMVQDSPTNFAWEEKVYHSIRKHFWSDFWCDMVQGEQLYPLWIASLKLRQISWMWLSSFQIRMPGREWRLLLCILASRVYRHRLTKRIFSGPANSKCVDPKNQRPIDDPRCIVYLSKMLLQTGRLLCSMDLGTWHAPALRCGRCPNVLQTYQNHEGRLNGFDRARNVFDFICDVSNTSLLWSRTTAWRLSFEESQKTGPTAS